MTSQAIKSYAKINLSLGVIKKIDSEYHKIESLISFLKFYDEISIEKIKNKNHKVEFFGKVEFFQKVEFFAEVEFYSRKYKN